MGKARSTEDWLKELNASGDQQVEAIADLREILLRGALYSLNRNLSELASFDQNEVLQLAEDCAQDALIAVLDHLHEFRGESKFTTWAYKFSINIALTTGRREWRKGVSLDQLTDHTEPVEWLSPEHHDLINPDHSLLQQEVFETIRETIRDELTEKQRQVLKWMVFDEVPMDVVVQHMRSNRNSVYKLLHDARLKVKRRLLMQGFGTDDALALFSMNKV
jgi:RNA polymerase sigma-70 factor (ECF subfamily)